MCKIRNLCLQKFPIHEYEKMLVLLMLSLFEYFYFMVLYNTQSFEAAGIT